MENENHTWRFVAGKIIYKYVVGDLYTYPSEKYEFVNGKDDIPCSMEK